MSEINRKKSIAKAIELAEEERSRRISEIENAKRESKFYSDFSSRVTDLKEEIARKEKTENKMDSLTD
ncbi:hypothetical protein MHBO_001394 [Bonamia ostreae]|uniref:Uncharacterized protein n=1 Tax=Bonamia ostreae TaxID=126728 RepID=A0ABV2AIU9_9EUKA